ncbi:hypothetical protein MINS_11120 [Mycolicibacterium insubricum]|nr:hypothetical protein MINS_11120 [Mycolicibacterium insubricum]
MRGRVCTELTQTVEDTAPDGVRRGREPGGRGIREALASSAVVPEIGCGHVGLRIIRWA